MTKNRLFPLVMMILNLLVLRAAGAAEFKIDRSHSSVSFKVSHLVVSSVRGQFRKFSGSWNVDPKTLELTNLKGTVQAKSVDTDNEKRDEHLRDGDFFDAKDNNEMTIRMVKFKPAETAGEGTLTAKVNIRGVTRKVDFDVKLTKVIPNPMDGGKTMKQGLSINGTVDREEFKIGEKYNAVIIGRDVSIELELEGDAIFPGGHEAAGKK